MRQRVEIEIEELVLHGFNPGDHEGIRQAIETELFRLINERGLAAPASASHKYPSIDGGKLVLQKGAKARAIGNGIAGNVYHSLKNL